VVFNVSFTLFSGTAPLVATTLIHEMDTLTAPALLMIGCGLLALVASFWIDRYGGHVLAGERYDKASI
jgi:MHS family proline/betaine transporter-like MFS transporter